MPSNSYNYSSLKCMLYLFLPSLISSFIHTVNIFHKSNTNILHLNKVSVSEDNNRILTDDSTIRIIKERKENLLNLLKSTPSNIATSTKLTDDILSKTKELEKTCPTLDENVLSKLAGSWELLWTTQDKDNDIVKSNSWWRTYIK